MRPFLATLCRRAADRLDPPCPAVPVHDSTRHLRAFAGEFLAARVASPRRLTAEEVAEIEQAVAAEMAEARKTDPFWIGIADLNRQAAEFRASLDAGPSRPAGLGERP